jgi:hypothetical protein
VATGAEALQQAVAGQERFVRLSLYAENQALELAGAGKFALVTRVVGVTSEGLWQPECT